MNCKQACTLANGNAGFAILYQQIFRSAVKAPCKRTQHVGQQLPALLNVTCCVRLHTLLHVVALVVVAQSLNTGQTFSNVQTDATTPNIIGPTMFGVVASVSS